MSLFVLLLVFLLLDLGLCYNVHHRIIMKYDNNRYNNNNKIIIKEDNQNMLIKKISNIKYYKIVTLIPIILGLSLQKPMISLATIETSNIVTTEENKVLLTASDVLNADVKPKIDLLNDVLFTIKLFPKIVEQYDYPQIRLSFRSGPTTELRKTCRKLIPFLEESKRNKFEKAYQEMIDELDYLDVLCLRRAQGEGIPDKGKTDDIMLNQISKLTTKFENMMSIVNN